LRCFAEQAIFDRIGPDWQQRVRNAFQEAAALYHASVAIRDEIRHAERLRDSVFNESPYYMRFVRRLPNAVTGDGLQPADLDDLLSQLTKLTDLLDRPGAARIDEVVHARSALAKLQQRVQWAVGDAAAEGLLARTPIPGDCWRAELLLRTPLLAAATRPELQAAVANLERESVEGYQPANVTHVASDTKLLATASSMLSAQQWDWLLQQARLEAKFAGLCQLYEVDRSGARRPLSRYEDFAAIWQALESLERKHQEFIDALDNSQNSLPSTATVVEPLWNAHARLGASLESFYGNIRVAPTIASACNEAAWRFSSRLLRMVDGRDAGRFRAVDIESLSATALLHSTMEWQASRLERASAYQSDGNSALLLDVADYYRRQLAEICQPPSELLSPSTLAVVARSQMDLQYASKMEFGVDFLNQGVQDVCAGICLDYDRDQLLVIPLVDSPHDEATRETAAADGGAADECPAFPQFAARPSVIKAGQGVRMRFQVVRRGTASQTSTLVIDAYETSIPSPAMDQAPPPATGGNSRLLARHKLAVLLPVAELVVQHASGADVSEHGAVTLAPFPNRLSAFKFGVINQSTTAKRVKLSLYSLSQALQDVQPDAFNALIAGQKPLVEFQLTAAGNAVPTFPAQEKAAEPAAEPSPAAADGGQQPPEEKTESPPAVPLTHGLLAVLEDPSSGQQTFREIEFTVQRPRRFVRPRVAYNSLNNRIEIEVTAQPRSLIPPGAPVRIGCRLASPLPGGLQGKLQDAIAAPDFKGKLFIAMPSTPPQNVRLYIDVDDFPRAFIFDVPCGKHSANIPEATALMDVRLVSSLPEGWSAARASIPVALEVDAPVGSFEDAEDFIELGVDVDGSGETEPASTVRLTADRSVSVGFLKALPDGTIQLQADVADFNIALPSNRLENVNVQVGTRIEVQGEVHQGPKIPFLIDTAPPIVGSVSPINYAGFVPVQGALELSVWVWDAGTGVQKVEAVFDTTNSGEFPAEGEFIQATQKTGRQWTLRMDAGEVSGSRILLVRGVDQVGNQGPAVKVPVEIVALDGVAARGKQQTVELTGTVSFRDASVPDVEMKLIAVPANPKLPVSGEEPLIVRTKPDGTYSIAGVRPGSYLLNAKGVLNNRVRRIAKEVTVAVGPQRSIQVDVALP
jgi:hypothetical protein